MGQGIKKKNMIKPRREIGASDLSKKGWSWKNRDRRMKREGKKFNDTNNKLKINDEKNQKKIKKKSKKNSK